MCGECKETPQAEGRGLTCWTPWPPSSLSRGCHASLLLLWSGGEPISQHGWSAFKISLNMWSVTCFFCWVTLKEVAMDSFTHYLCFPWLTWAFVWILFIWPPVFYVLSDSFLMMSVCSQISTNTLISATLFPLEVMDHKNKTEIILQYDPVNPFNMQNVVRKIKCKCH